VAILFRTNSTCLAYIEGHPKYFIGSAAATFMSGQLKHFQSRMSFVAFPPTAHQPASCSRGCGCACSCSHLCHLQSSYQQFQSAMLIKPHTTDTATLHMFTLLFITLKGIQSTSLDQLLPPSYQDSSSIADPSCPSLPYHPDTRNNHIPHCPAAPYCCHTSC
jgi:hypothetical protein